ncbi:MAG: hypothetical protein K2K23_02335, partial [Muribaculaceae bacterium]|nr:hypothetical protein [Muribaculaceae bacterium]
YKRGKGPLNLAEGNSINRLIIEDGTVYASEINDIISLPSTVEFVNGSLWDPANMSTYSKNTTNYFVADGNRGSLYLDSRCSYSGKLTGKGTLSVFASGVRCDLTGDWSGFVGELVACQYKRGNYDPDFKWDNNYSMPKATLNISSGVTFNAQTNNIKLGNLKGYGTYSGTGTLTVGNDEKAISFSGTFSGNPKVVKIGKCDLNITKAWSGLANLTVQDGTMSLNASKSPYNTEFLTIPLTIEGNAKLRGRGTVGNITVAGNGVIESGSFSDSNPHHYGPIFSNGDVTVNSGSTLSLYLRVAGKSNDCSYLDVKGSLTINGNVVVTMNPEYTPAVGDQFQLWKSGSFSGTPNIELPKLPTGLAWDCEGLKDNSGILKVVVGSGVSTISDVAQVVCKVYDTMGICLGTFETTKGNAIETVRNALNISSGIYYLVLYAEGYSETLKLQF